MSVRATSAVAAENPGPVASVTVITPVELSVDSPGPAVSVAVGPVDSSVTGTSAAGVSGASTVAGVSGVATVAGVSGVTWSMGVAVGVTWPTGSFPAPSAASLTDSESGLTDSGTGNAPLRSVADSCLASRIDAAMRKTEGSSSYS